MNLDKGTLTDIVYAAAGSVQKGVKAMRQTRAVRENVIDVEEVDA